VAVDGLRIDLERNFEFSGDHIHLACGAFFISIAAGLGTLAFVDWGELHDAGAGG
jgi:hypothetical protein